MDPYTQNNKMSHQDFSSFITLASGSSSNSPAVATTLGRYENQKRRDWNTFCQYLKNHHPPLFIQQCSGAHVLEFLCYLDHEISMDPYTQNNKMSHQDFSSFITLASGSSSNSPAVATTLGRYENQKRRDWNTFCQYLKNHHPPLFIQQCSGAHVLEFLCYLDQFGKTKVHTLICPFYGHPNPPAPCPCPLRQAWGSLDALIGRLRAAYEENGGAPEVNPFGARPVKLYLREIRELQSKARGISYEKKKRKRLAPQQDHDDS